MSATIKEEVVMTTEEFRKFADTIAEAIKDFESSENKTKKYIDEIKIRRKELIATLVDCLDIKLPKHTVDSTISVHSPDKSHLVEIYETLEETVVRIKHVRDIEHV